MNENPRILLLTASYGDGHLKAAHALKQRFHKRGITHVQTIDLMQEAHPLINKMSTITYSWSFQASRFGLNYYGWSYYLTSQSSEQNPLSTCLNLMGKKKLTQIIARERPDAIVSTFPYGAAPSVGRALQIPVYTIITDFTLHSRWVHTGIDKYYVASGDLMNALISSGVHPDKIAVTGIPLRETFDENLRTDAARNRVLILAGSHSVPRTTAEMIGKLLAIQGIRVTVVCGRNQRLEQVLKQRFADRPHVRIFGFVENIHELMAHSGCIITKAGGLTLAESLALQVPVFIFKPFAGQERENAIYFSEKGVTSISNHMNELIVQMERFVSDESRFDEIKLRMASLQKTNAADLIVRDILTELGRSDPASAYS